MYTIIGLEKKNIKLTSLLRHFSDIGIKSQKIDDLFYLIHVSTINNYSSKLQSA